nr:unnamed protein product [Digitaria exilis]
MDRSSRGRQHCNSNGTTLMQGIMLRLAIRLDDGQQPARPSNGSSAAPFPGFTWFRFGQTCFYRCLRPST